MSRTQWVSLPDEQLLAQCSVDTYRASGPGGQKRNKTSSAVRLRHEPSGVRVIAEESRSQHENKVRAIRRLRREMCLALREPFAPGTYNLDVGAKDARYWPTAGIVLDCLAAHRARVGESAAALGASTARLIAFLQMDGKLWQRANEMRIAHEQKPLR